MSYPDVKPPQLTDPEWVAAMEGNRDKALLIPVVVHGFQGLKDKVGQQNASVDQFKKAAEVSAPPSLPACVRVCLVGWCPVCVRRALCRVCACVCRRRPSPSAPDHHLCSAIVPPIDPVSVCPCPCSCTPCFCELCWMEESHRCTITL